VRCRWRAIAPMKLLIDTGRVDITLDIAMAEHPCRGQQVLGMRKWYSYSSTW
jgi:hypothetical protein